MAHYFDDIFKRSVDGTRTPNPGGMPRLRRSSTGRSIGARSDYDDTPTGADDDDAQSTTNSVFVESPEETKRRSDADTHMHQYISTRLDQYKKNDAAGPFGEADEYEATP
jgi:hypothetical protein